MDAVLHWLEDWVHHVNWVYFISIPIFTGGLTTSQVRAATEQMGGETVAQGMH